MKLLLILITLFTSLGSLANPKASARKLYIGGKGAYPNKAQLDDFYQGYSQAGDKRKFLIDNIIKTREFFYGTCQLMFAHFFSEEILDEALRQPSSINGDGSLTLCRAVWDSNTIPFHKAFTAPFFYRLVPGTYQGEDGETKVVSRSGRYNVTFADAQTGKRKTEVCAFYNSANSKHHNCIAQHKLNPLAMKRMPQISNTHELYADELVGILTTRQWATEWLRDGTNRSALAYGVLERLLGKTMNDLFDISTPNTFVRYDVGRDDPIEYANKCIGCHSGMDPLLSAFAYHDSSGNSLKIRDFRRPNPANPNQQIIYGPVHFKFFDDRKMQEPTAIPITSNAWENLWCKGKNADIFSGGDCEGVGLRSFMEAMVKSPEFAKQMARTAYRGVCGLKTNQYPQLLIERSAKNFADSGNMMALIADSLLACHDQNEYKKLMGVR